MLQLVIRMARHRLTSLAAVAFAVLGGIALLTATGVIAESGIRSHAPVDRLARADIVVTGKQAISAPGMPALLPERHRISTDMVEKLAKLPGVRRAVGDVSFPAALLGTDGHIITTGATPTAAHGWSSAALLSNAGLVGKAPAGIDEVAVGSRAASSAHLTVGDDVGIAAAGHPAKRYRVSAILRGGAGSVYFSNSAATELNGRGVAPRSNSVDLIGLKVNKNSLDSVASTVRRDLRGSGLVVSTGSTRGDAVSPDVAAARSSLLLVAGSLAGIVLMLVGFVVTGAVAVSVAGQRRSLALIRSVGATPRQTRHMVAGEATMVSLLAIIPGLILGYVLASQLGRLLRAVDILPSTLPLTFSPLPAVAAIVSMLGVVQSSARAAAWRTSRMAPMDAIGESACEARHPSILRARIGLLIILAATTMSAAPLVVQSEIGAAAASTAGIFAAVGLAIAGPYLLRSASDAIAGWIPTSGSVTTWLAVSNMRVFVARFSSVITASAMLLVFTLTYAFSQTTLLRATADSVQAGTTAQFALTADQRGGLPNNLLDRVRDLKGVHGAATVTTTAVVWPHKVFGDVEIETEPAMILDPSAGRVLDLQVQRGSLTQLTGNTVAVSRGVAKSRDADLGQTIKLTLGDGSKIRARVVATYNRNLGFSEIVLSHDLAIGHTTSGLDQSILVRANNVQQAGQQLATLASSVPGLAVSDTTTDTKQSFASPALWLNVATIIVLLGYLALTIANRIVATTMQRKGEISALQAAGATRRQILAMTRKESAIMGATACLAAVAVSALPLAFLGIGFLGRPWPAGPVWLLPATTLFIMGLTIATVDLPTRALLRPSAKAA